MTDRFYQDKMLKIFKYNFLGLYGIEECKAPSFLPAILIEYVYENCLSMGGCTDEDPEFWLTEY